jgi:uncharacterized protein YbjT (DUF2867 family)
MSGADILVTGAAGGRQGSTGNHVTRMLLDRGVSVRAFVHRSDERSERIRALGADVVEGDLSDLRSVRAAMAGVRRAYFTYPVQGGLLEATATFASAARDAGVDRVVNLSQLLAADGVQPTPHQQRHWLAERMFDWAGVGAVHLDAVVFYENLYAMARGSLAAAGVLALPWGPESTPIPMVAAEDVARVAAAVLTGPDLPNGTVLPLIGSVVTVSEILDVFGQVLGRPVPYRELTDDEWVAAVADAQINSTAVEHLVHLWRYLRTRPRGDVPDTIKDLTGAEPTSLLEFLHARREVFTT